MHFPANFLSPHSISLTLTFLGAKNLPVLDADLKRSETLKPSNEVLRPDLRPFPSISISATAGFPFLSQGFFTSDNGNPRTNAKRREICVEVAGQVAKRLIRPARKIYSCLASSFVV